MGLDITAYRQLAKIDGVQMLDGEPVGASGEPVDYDLIAYVNDDFPGRNGSIEDGIAYLAKERTCFSAGSYGGYNAWRNELATIAGWPEGSHHQSGRDWPTHCAACWAGEEGPFSEIINFSDCEGVIGPEVSAKLAADFARFDDAAKASAFPQFYDRYQEWREAFEMASDNGAVRFH